MEGFINQESTLLYLYNPYRVFACVYDVYVYVLHTIMFIHYCVHV